MHQLQRTGCGATALYIFPALQAFQGDLPGIQSLMGEPKEVTIATVSGCKKLTDWMNIFRITQASPTMCTHLTLLLACFNSYCRFLQGAAWRQCQLAVR